MQQPRGGDDKDSGREPPFGADEIPALPAELWDVIVERLCDGEQFLDVRLYCRSLRDSFSRVAMRLHGDALCRKGGVRVLLSCDDWVARACLDRQARRKRKAGRWSGRGPKEDRASAEHRRPDSACSITVSWRSAPNRRGLLLLGAQEARRLAEEVVPQGFIFAPAPLPASVRRKVVLPCSYGIDDSSVLAFLDDTRDVDRVPPPWSFNPDCEWTACKTLCAGFWKAMAIMNSDSEGRIPPGEFGTTVRKHLCLLLNSSGIKAIASRAAQSDNPHHLALLERMCFTACTANGPQLLRICSGDTRIAFRVAESMRRHGFLGKPREGALTGTFPVLAKAVLREHGVKLGVGAAKLPEANPPAPEGDVSSPIEGAQLLDSDSLSDLDLELGLDVNLDLDLDSDSGSNADLDLRSALMADETSPGQWQWSDGSDSDDEGRRRGFPSFMRRHAVSADPIRSVERVLAEQLEMMFIARRFE